ncbi:hypothetical protein [Streptomyces sp. NPDC056105]
MRESSIGVGFGEWSQDTRTVSIAAPRHRVNASNARKWAPSG